MNVELTLFSIFFHFLHFYLKTMHILQTRIHEWVFNTSPGVSQKCATARFRSDVIVGRKPAKMLESGRR